jgi:hypothetical protein
MAIPDQERQAIVEAASAILGLKEWTEHLGAQQGGTISRLSDDESKRILEPYERLRKLLRRLAFNHNIQPAVRFRGMIFALGLPTETLVVIPEDKIETIEV